VQRSTFTCGNGSFKPNENKQSQSQAVNAGVGPTCSQTTSINHNNNRPHTPDTIRNRLASLQVKHEAVRRRHESEEQARTRRRAAAKLAIHTRSHVCSATSLQMFSLTFNASVLQ
jgi:hypothetical protein